MLRIFIVLLLSAGSCLAYAGKPNNTDKPDSVANLAQELVKLRDQVEEFNRALDDRKAQYKSRMLSLANQRSELEIEIKRQVSTLKQARQAIDKNRQRINELGAQNKDIKPALFTAVDAIRVYIERGIPFKVSERLSALDKIHQQLSSDVISADKAANHLWSFVEDELRLTSENGLHRQTIDIDGHEVLADVAKLGMIMMYFELPDGSFGQVTKHASTFKFEKFTDKSRSDKVSVLFDALRKQIRQGYFELPNSFSATTPL